jgi:hypothetical protein
MKTDPWGESALSRRLREARAKALLDEQAPGKRVRQRKPSIASAIAQARKAGERGQVRVTIGGVTVTSEREHEPTTTGNGASNGVSEWDTL